MGDWRYPGSKPQRADPCDGCHECGSRCTAGVQMARDEFDLILKHLQTLDAAEALRVLNEDKTWVWFEDAQVQACCFYDMRQRRCLVYPARPLICRLFGRVEWLPCPLGKAVPQLRGGWELVQVYAQQRRATFPEWCSETGIFNFQQLLTKSS